MKFFKKTVFWIIVFAVLGGTFYILDKRAEEKKAIEEFKRRLFPFEPDDVVEFAVKRKDGEIVVRRGDDGWNVVEPVRTRGDEKRIEKFLRGLVRAKFDGILFEEPPPGKLRELGLDSPYLEVSLKTSDTTRTIYFGNKGPTHNVSFAMLKDDPRVFRIHTDIRSDADKKVYDLRDKRILGFDPIKAKKLEIVWTEGERIVVEHPLEGKWDAQGLPEGKTSFIRLMEMLVRFRNSEIKAFVDESPEGLESYGLKKPRVSLLFVDKDGNIHSIFLGKRDKKRRGVFAMRGDGEKGVFLLEEDVMDTIPRSVQDLLEEGQDDGEEA